MPQHRLTHGGLALYSHNVVLDLRRVPPTPMSPNLAFRNVLTVPKEAILKEEAKEKRQREKKRAGKKPH